MLLNELCRFFVSNVAHCTHSTLSSCLIHSNHINQECAIAFVNKSRYTLERCTKICFLSSGAIIVSLSIPLSLALALAHSLTFSISSWSFLVKPSRKMHCTCVINKCNAIAERKKKNQERSQWILLEIFSMQSDTDMRIFEGFKTNKLDRRNECVKWTVALLLFFASFPFHFQYDVEANTKMRYEYSSTEVRVWVCLHGRACHSEFQQNIFCFVKLVCCSIFLIH